jgi:hypothetical protein
LSLLRQKRSAEKRDILDELRESHPEVLNERENPVSPAESLLETCLRHGIVLTIDPANGDLLVTGAFTDPWPTLMLALEAHRSAMAALVHAGRQLRANFPRAASDQGREH